VVYAQNNVSYLVVMRDIILIPVSVEDAYRDIGIALISTETLF